MMNEDKIIISAKDSSEEAFRYLYDKYKERIYRMAYRYTKSAENAEDIMQETFIKAFKKISTFRNDDINSFSTWLTRICINNSLTHLKKSKKYGKDVIISISDGDVEISTSNNQPDTIVQSKSLKELIQKAIEVLSPKQKIIFDLRYTQHHDLNKIAEIMQCSLGNVKSQLFRTKEKLQKKLAPLWEEI